tara:strand:+ start:162 stop:545 length:384 start_codon:yes stop_codon:yes gene_type:complete
MKFNKTHLFFIILAVALLSTLGFTIKEGLTNKSSKTASFWRERRGMRRRDIKSGDEDLYVLKSSIVPPVCPKCPQRSACPRQKPCPPCAPCARCPEPAFTCKKVPNYNSTNNQYLPLPWLSQGQGRL